MANVRKRILELTPLPSASLDTTIVGVDGGTTYRIELDVLADAVTSRVNILDRDRLASLESVTSSFESKGRSVISSSAQITAFGFISSSVTIPTGTISSSAQITSFGFISSSATIPAGTISSSAQITTLGFISSSTDITSLNSFTSSQSSLNTAFTNGISARLQTSSFNEYTASQSTSSLVNRLNAIESVSGSWITESETGSFLTNLSGAISSSTQISDLGFVTGSYTTINSFNSLTQSFNSISQSFNVISGSVVSIQGGFDTGSYQTFTTSVNTSISNLNTFTASVSTASLVTSISNLNSATSSYLTSLSGAISSSSQLTSSYDTRYVISGSVGATPSGTISGSSQLTSSFDSRYTQTGSFNTLTASFNSFTASAQTVTTGSNSFTGTNVFSGSTTLRGAVNVGTGSGFEGGEILLAYAQGGSTSLTGSSLVVDVYADKLRIFESGGNSRGAYLDLTKQADGVGSEILTKVSGLVNRGVDVTLGNLKARIAATGNISLQLSTVSGTYSVYGSSVYSQGGAAGTTIDGGSPRTISTTPAYLNSGYNFATAGATDTWNIMDTSNSIAWRITMILGAGVNNNLVSIERLH